MTSLVAIPAPAHVVPRWRAKRIVRRYERLLAQVVVDSWRDWEQMGQYAPQQVGSLRSSARAFNVSDFLTDNVGRLFSPVGAAHVVHKYKRAQVLLCKGAVLVRFKKLSPDLAVSSSPTNRQANVAAHMEPSPFPGLPAPTQLTVGYVLDRTGMQLRQIEAVCHVGTNVLYHFPLTIPQQVSAPVAAPAVTGRSGLVRSSRDEAASGSDGGAAPAAGA